MANKAPTKSGISFFSAGKNGLFNIWGRSAAEATDTEAEDSDTGGADSKRSKLQKKAEEAIKPAAPVSPPKISENSNFVQPKKKPEPQADILADFGIATDDEDGNPDDLVLDDSPKPPPPKPKTPVKAPAAPKAPLPKTPVKAPTAPAPKTPIKETVIHQPPVFAAEVETKKDVEIQKEAVASVPVEIKQAPMDVEPKKAKSELKPKKRKRAEEQTAVEQALTWAAMARLHRRAAVPEDKIRKVRRLHADGKQAASSEEEDPLVMKMSAIADPDADGKNMKQVTCESFMDNLVPLVRAAMLVNEYRGGKTVMCADVKYALALMGKKMYGEPEGLAFNATEKARKKAEAEEEYVPDPEDAKAMELEDKRDYYSEAEGDCDL